MKKKEIGMISLLVIVICLMIFSITKSNIESNNLKSVIATIDSSTEVLKSEEEVTLEVKLQISDNIKDKVNIFRGYIEFDESVFESITLDDFKVYGSWEYLEYNEDTKEFIILNLDSLSKEEKVMQITLRTKEEIPSVEKTSIGITKMETALYDEDDVLIITNEDGNTLEEVILTKEKEVKDEETTTKTSTTSTTSTTNKVTTTSKITTSTTKKTEVSVIPTTTTTTTTTTTSSTTTQTSTTTSKKTTTKKTTTTTTTANEEVTSTTTATITTTKESKSFFEKNNQANKKVLIIVIVVILILIALATYRYNKFKNMNLFFIILASILLLSSPLVKALSNVLGDIDNDGVITINDISNLEKYLINLDSLVDDDNLDTVDLNNDGTVSTVDLAILIHMMLNPEIDDDVIDEESPTAKEVLSEISIGWNLGNSLDSTNYKKEYLGEEYNISYYETLWGNPKTTKELIDTVKKAGFNSIRVPVTYYDHILSDGTIDESWLKRVEEVINYVLDNDLYCILDMHHDTGLYEGGSWIVADEGKLEENAQKLESIWTQVATYFKDYDYKLIFEGLNETVDTNRQGYDWNSGTEITLNVLKLNQVFVDTVRATGGKNANRVLAVTTYGGITDEHKLSLFTMPVDTVQDRIILSVHDYATEESDIDAMFERIKTYILAKDIPIMIDEFGTQTYLGDEKRAEVATYYVSKAHALNIPCYVWDDGGNYQILDRNTLTWKYPKLMEALIKAANN